MIKERLKTPNDPEKMGLAYDVIDELRELRPFEPTADIDMVWVLSAPGTYDEVSDDGIYEGISADSVNIQAGIDLVKTITGLKLNKQPDAVTKEDIEAVGPTLFYNGEDKDTQNVKYLQNEALARAAEDPDFPIPQSKLVIDRIPGIGTPAQVIGIAEYLKTHGYQGKVATVSMAHHSMRVSRYLQHHKDLLPEGVTFLNAYIPGEINNVGMTVREVRKIGIYAAKGDLSKESYFKLHPPEN